MKPRSCAPRENLTSYENGRNWCKVKREQLQPPCSPRIIAAKQMLEVRALREEGRERRGCVCMRKGQSEKVTESYPRWGKKPSEDPPKVGMGEGEAAKAAAAGATCAAREAL